jgi:hypothetical protein
LAKAAVIANAAQKAPLARFIVPAAAKIRIRAEAVSLEVLSAAIERERLVGHDGVGCIVVAQY